MQDKRVHPRRPIELEFDCELPTGETFSAVSHDISLGGMFIVTEHSPAFGTQVTIVVTLSGGTPSRLPAIVRWTNESGIGVQFGLLGARETHAIAQLLRG